MVSTKVSQVKFFVCHNTGITLYDLRINLHNWIFSWDDESDSDVKVLCDPHKNWVSYSLPLDPTHGFVYAQLLTTQSSLPRPAIKFRRATHAPVLSSLLHSPHDSQQHGDFSRTLLTGGWLGSVKLLLRAYLGHRLSISQDQSGHKTALIQNITGPTFCSS